MLDQTVVAVALGPMARSLGLTAFEMHAVVLVYILALAAFAPVGGMAARRYGLLRTFRFGTAAFALASGLCGLAPLYACGEVGPTDPRTFAVLATGVVTLAVAVRLVLRSRHPLVDLRLLGNRPYAVAVGLTFMVQAPQLIVLVHGTLFLRQVVHLSVLATGVCLLPLVTAMATGTLLSGHLLERSGSIRVPVLAGLVAAVLGAALWTAALPSRAYPWQVPGMVLAGFGMGLPVPALSAELMRAVPDHKRADASVLRQTLRQLGGAVGLATAGAVVLAANAEAADEAGVVTVAAAPAGFVVATCVLAVALLPGRAGVSRRRGR
ncbi:MFS transporter [Streptomyces sp. NRRL S-87]|uniref:MFS transporter n=1 Tax=Streptomyces sp. NRRL S-87 TaxID=1463920 RepID=UPI0004BF0161|nr:MFS transporter [Streptomyces sp. NRRL S-87]